LLKPAGASIGGIPVATPDACYTPRMQVSRLTTQDLQAQGSSPQAFRATRLTHPLPGPSRYLQGRGKSLQAPCTRAATVCAPSTCGATLQAYLQRLGTESVGGGASTARASTARVGALRFKSTPVASTHENATSVFTKRIASVSTAEPQSARQSQSFTPLASPTSRFGGSPCSVATTPDLRLVNWHEEWQRHSVSARRSKSVCENLPKFQPPEFEFPLAIPESPDSLLQSSRAATFTEWPLGNATIDFGKVMNVTSDAERDTASEMGEGVIESSCTSTVWGDFGDNDDRNLPCGEVVELPHHCGVEKSEESLLATEPLSEVQNQSASSFVEIEYHEVHSHDGEQLDRLSQSEKSAIIVTGEDEKSLEIGMDTFRSCKESEKASEIGLDTLDSFRSCKDSVDVNEDEESANYSSTPLQICTNTFEVEPLCLSVRSAWTPAWSVLDTPCSDAFGQWPDSRRVSDVSESVPGMRGFARLNLPPIQIAESEDIGSLAAIGNVSPPPSTTCNYSDSDDSDEDNASEALDATLTSPAAADPRNALLGRSTQTLSIEIPTPSTSSVSRVGEANDDWPMVAMTTGIDCSSFASPYAYSPCSPPATCKYTDRKSSDIDNEAHTLDECVPRNLITNVASPARSPNCKMDPSSPEAAHFVFPCTNLPPQRPVNRDAMRSRPTKGQCKQAAITAARARKGSGNKVSSLRAKFEAAL